ncbi:UDP-N-acetylmuramoyl-L-alanyl-D-glutamate--2,6-diaminopimelate ligase [Rhodococcus sp. X156]|uniref:UDP-N-acetylmuramoyl-L-alanyl-D-glutamate--2, 6-diaminopimelate ligase n=1 Tax=Rhodococcus sp. X156 TaxID=2499145 RepID=UPI001F49458D|nr:UDP-N-acetylmuramoyl-L-alanyl-D-glutamate--2,6-diaminopimelate ligase [Rhodococcus sp. X156]
MNRDFWLAVDFWLAASVPMTRPPAAPAALGRTVCDVAAHLGLAATGTTGELARSVTGVSDDSRTVTAGDLYVALPGEREHGLTFEAEAAARGAVAVLSDRPATALPCLVVSDPRRHVGPLAAWIHDHPSARLDVYGVTGTNGKTSATYLVDAGLSGAGVRNAMITGIAIRSPAGSWPAQRTTPEAAVLQRLLAGFRDEGALAAAMEVSSHAVSQRRVDGIRFRVVAFTNLGRDHLDYHRTMEEYYAAKAALFTPERAGAAVVNVDDPYGRRLCASTDLPVWTHSTRDPTADVFADGIACDAEGTRFTVHTPSGRLPVSLALLGPHQVANALTALTSLVLAGVDLRGAVHGMEQLARVPGRLERVDVGQPFLALVDYMHNSAGQRSLLPFLRSLTTGRLLVVLGATGDRDPGKRFRLGATAAELADVVVVTDESPRSEPADRVREAVAAGARSVRGGELVVEPDRRRALEQAAARARPGDVLVVAGRGADGHQVYGEQVRPFDDREQLAQVLDRRR